MRWRWWRHDSNGAAAAKTEAEIKLRAAKRMTREVEKMADLVAELPADEFADRVSRAFRRRPA